MRKFVFMLIVLAMVTLACRLAAVTPSPSPRPAFTRTQRPTATVVPSDTPTNTLTPSATSTRTSTPSATPTSTPTATELPPTFTPTPTNTSEPSPSPLPVSLQLKVFNDLWDVVNEEYLYPDFNGLDWNQIYDEYRPKIEAGMSNVEFYDALKEMIFRLGDDHSAYLTPQEVADEEAKYTGHMDYVGIGVIVQAVPERQRAVIIVVFPDSPAEAAGLQWHDSLLKVDGEPILDGEGFIKPILRGPEGTQATVTVQSPGGEPRDIPITRHRITGSTPVPFTVLNTPDGRRVGYILISTFSDSTVDEQIGQALETMGEQAPLDGLILDDRQNPGGADTVLIPTLSYFTSGTMGYFISRNDERPLLVQDPLDIYGSQDVPLVVMVGRDTVSYGEVFAGVLKDIGRAYLIGETTDGNVETLWGYDFDDGSRAWIAHESFRPLSHPAQDWEQTGIIPHLTVIAAWDEYMLDTDPAVQAALDYLDGR